MYTGDIGSFDSAGFLTLKDRSNDVIISGGANIYPREVEEILLRHDSIKEVAVIGWPDREWGEAVMAVVACDTPDDTRLEEILDRLCLDNIARFKRPKRYVFVDRLPKNNYAKIAKRLVREMLKEDES